MLPEYAVEDGIHYCKAKMLARIFAFGVCPERVTTFMAPFMGHGSPHNALFIFIFDIYGYGSINARVMLCAWVLYLQIFTELRVYHLQASLCKGFAIYNMLSIQIILLGMLQGALSVNN